MLSKTERSDAHGVTDSRIRQIVHIPKVQQSVFEDENSGFSRRCLSPILPGCDIDWLLMTLPPKGATKDIDSHRRGLKEYVYVLEGRLSADIGGQVTILESGDSLYFEADTKYAFSNLGRAACRYFLIIDSSDVRRVERTTISTPT
jgi:mannose-6-phosphate isomerase-like protein (cupin superfamily)